VDQKSGDNEHPELLPKRGLGLRKDGRLKGEKTSTKRKGQQETVSKNQKIRVDETRGIAREEVLSAYWGISEHPTTQNLNSSR